MACDCELILTSIRDEIRRIADAHEIIRDNVILIRERHTDIQEDFRVLKLRGDDENEGIVTRNTCRPCDGAFIRSAIVNAVKQSGQAQNIANEVENQSPVPGLEIQD